MQYLLKLTVLAVAISQAVPAFAGFTEAGPGKSVEPVFETVPQALAHPVARVGIIINGPGKAFVSQWGHVDLILNPYDGYPVLEAAVVGFGPATTDMKDFLKMKGTPFIDWGTNFAHTYQDFLDGQREWVEVILLKNTTDAKKQAFIDSIRQMHESIAETANPRLLYGTLNQNCSTLGSNAIIATVDPEERAPLVDPAEIERHRPTLIKDYLIKHGIHFDSYLYNEEFPTDPDHQEY